MVYDHPIVDRVYRSGPVLLQDALVSAYGGLKILERRRAVYRHYLRHLQESQWWTPQQLLELQEQRLRTMVAHAYENVAYYRQLFDRLRLKPADIRTADDLYKLPVLTKEELRNHHGELRARNVPPARTTVGRTGGTTGIPLHFLLDKNRVIFDHVLIHRHWSWAGYSPRDGVAVVRGFTLVPSDARPGRYWRHDWVDNRLYLSGFHLSLQTMPQYVRKLKQWKPKFLAGYPSNIFTLARFMEAHNQVIPICAVFTSSEVLTPTERKVIESQFACKVWDRYGTGERLAVGQQCELGSYHQNVEYGVLQVDSPRGQPAAPGQKGELIQTTLTNFSMPLLRYASEDTGYSVAGACGCGRGLAMMGAVEGRKDDVIVTAEGRLMPRAGLDQIHELVENLERCQLVQRQIGEVIVRVLPRPAFGPADVAELQQQLRKRLGTSTAIRVETVTELQLTASGKERFIVSHLDPAAIAGLRLEYDHERTDVTT